MQRQRTTSFDGDRFSQKKFANSLFWRPLGSLLGLCLLGLTIILAIALISWHMSDPSLSYATGNSVQNQTGRFGALYADLAMQFLGLASVAMLLPMFFWASLLIIGRTIGYGFLRIFFFCLGLASFCAALASLSKVAGWPLNSGMGGVLGDKIVYGIEFMMHKPLSYSYHVIFTIVILPFAMWAMAVAGGVAWVYKPTRLPKKLARAPKLKPIEADPDFDELPPDLLLDGKIIDNKITEEADASVFLGKLLHNYLVICAAMKRFASCMALFKKPTIRRKTIEPSFAEDQLLVLDPAFPTSIAATKPRREKTLSSKAPKTSKIPNIATNVFRSMGFELPAVGFLTPQPRRRPGAQLSEEQLRKNAQQLAAVLDDFGVKGQIINVRPGPVVTLYELEPAPGIKSSRIIGLADDIARSMSALSARVAVVPGRNVIGIELPNAERETVYLRSLLESKEYNESRAGLALALGQDIGGEPVIADLAKMPHLLVAGTTGSGKSVGINTMILSLLYKLTPEQCRFIMVDPKMLELSVYEGIPHLLSPVVTEPKKAIVALKWAVREMEDRYRKMAKLGVRNIDGFNKRILDLSQKGEQITREVQSGFDKETGAAIFQTETLELKHLPYIVIIIDEMADLMMVAGKEIEAAVQRLAQMARAAGIHVVMATQRPSVDVITGTIKANFPTRISFSVTSKIDSRTILGEQGAEQLLGQGDMLFMMGGGRIQRVHGPFVNDTEVEEIVNHLKRQGLPDYLDDVTKEDEEESANTATQNLSQSDDIYDQAVAVVLRDRKVSTSYIQRRLSIGYNKAASLVERMEDEGLISAANQVGKREILVPEEG